jgi:hypothetical protein
MKKWSARFQTSAIKDHIEDFGYTGGQAKIILPLIHPFRLVATAKTTPVQWLADGNPGHVYPLHDCPHNRQTARFRGEGINLISSLSNVTKKAFNRIGRAVGK